MMRPIGIGLAVAFVMAALMGASTAMAAPKDTSATDVPPLIQAANVPCTVTGSRFIFQGQLSDKVNAKIYEVSCQEGLGYILLARDKAPPVQAVNCIAEAQPLPEGKKNNLLCTLPGNANPASALARYVTAGGRNCDIDKNRVIGTTEAMSLYEVSCQGGSGYIILVPRSGAAAPTLNPCVGYDELNSSLKCELTAPAQRAAYVDQIVAASGKNCSIKTKRYVGKTADQSDFIEVACTDGKGYIIQSDNAGKFREATDCVNAGGLGGGCTLTDTREAQTQENNLYGDLAKKAGFDCKVSKYAALPVQNAGAEVVELQCSNRPDGGIGMFPARGAPRVLDCLRSQTEGYKCSFSPESAVYPHLYAQLQAKGKPSCQVSGARPFAHLTTGEDLIEVACSDGGPGWVLEYPASGGSQPSSLLNCAQAAQISGAGGCQLPTNRKH